MTPSPWLLEHAWAKHGSCMAKTPERYFRVAGVLWRGVTLHHCGQFPLRASGQSPCSTKPNRPFCPEHCIEVRSFRQYSGDQLTART
jgi:hypothetical protein